VIYEFMRLAGKQLVGVVCDAVAVVLGRRAVGGMQTQL
jgi:hypothetical protein